MGETLTYKMLRDLQKQYPPAPPALVIMPVNEIPVIVPVKTHRKKRINKKWLKRYGTKVVFDRFLGDKVCIIGNYAYCHPDVANRLMQQEIEQHRWRYGCDQK